MFKEPLTKLKADVPRVVKPVEAPVSTALLNDSIKWIANDPRLANLKVDADGTSIIKLIRMNPGACPLNSERIHDRQNAWLKITPDEIILGCHCKSYPSMVLRENDRQLGGVAVTEAEAEVEKDDESDVFDNEENYDDTQYDTPDDTSDDAPVVDAPVIETPVIETPVMTEKARIKQEKQAVKAHERAEKQAAKARERAADKRERAAEREKEKQRKEAIKRSMKLFELTGLNSAQWDLRLKEKDRLSAVASEVVGMV